MIKKINRVKRNLCHTVCKVEGKTECHLKSVWSLGDAGFMKFHHIFGMCVWCFHIIGVYVCTFVCVYFLQRPGSTPYYKYRLCVPVTERRAVEFVISKHPGSSIKLSAYCYVTGIQRITSFQFSKWEKPIFALRGTVSVASGNLF